MRLTRSFLAIVLSFSLSLAAFFALPIQTSNAQELKIALQRGYRTGYSDGYMAGYRDSIDNNSKDYARHDDYAKANRAYNKDYGTAEDYKDGYQQGFESGYGTGFEKRSFEAAIPDNLNIRGAAALENLPAETIAEQTLAAENTAAALENATTAVPDSITSNQPVPASDIIQKTSFQPASDAVILIPQDTELIVELQEDINTGRNREGDKFTAKIISPIEISGAMIEGRVSKITKPGRIKRRSEMLLSFDRVILTENRWSNFNASLTEVLPSKGDNVRRVDNEGTAVGNHSFKQDGIRIGAATGSGVVIGAVTGGPVGAAVGAGVGAAFGVGAVVIERGKNINLVKSQQLRIKTSYETRIR